MRVTGSLLAAATDRSSHPYVLRAGSDPRRWPSGTSTTTVTRTSLSSIFTLPTSGSSSAEAMEASTPPHDLRPADGRAASPRVISMATGRRTSPWPPSGRDRFRSSSVARNRGDVVHRQLAHPPIELSDARANVVLPRLRGLVLGVLGEIAVRAGRLELLGQPDVQLVLEIRQLLLEPGDDR